MQVRARASDYLMKPFEITQLRETVYRCLKEFGLLRMSERSLRENLGNARNRRKALGLTLADVAKRSNVSLGYLSQIELGKSSASVETLYRVCLTLHCASRICFRPFKNPEPRGKNRHRSRRSENHLVLICAICGDFIRR